MSTPTLKGTILVVMGLSHGKRVAVARHSKLSILFPMVSLGFLRGTLCARCRVLVDSAHFVESGCICTKSSDSGLFGMLAMVI